MNAAALCLDEDALRLNHDTLCITVEALCMGADGVGLSRYRLCAHPNAVCLDSDALDLNRDAMRFANRTMWFRLIAAGIFHHGEHGGHGANARSRGRHRGTFAGEVSAADVDNAACFSGPDSGSVTSEVVCSHHD